MIFVIVWNCGYNFSKVLNDLKFKLLRLEISKIKENEKKNYKRDCQGIKKLNKEKKKNN